MAYYSDEHDEDDLPVVTLPNSKFARRVSNNDDSDDQDNTDNDRSSKLVNNWRNLYETSINSLQSDDEDPKSFHMDRPPSFEKPPIKLKERPKSPINQPQLDPYINKSKWEIRLPELLNGTVGPDRQKRDITRRYTTNMVFQRSDSQNKEFNPYFEHNGQPSINPLVKQLKQKFDRMTATANNTQPSPLPPPKIQRVASQTYRRLTANIDERLNQRSRPVLPIRPNPALTTVRPRSASSGSSVNQTPVPNGRAHREKAGPPVSYPKHFYPPPSTTSVVKQLIGGGATLVYDSITQQTGSQRKGIVKSQRSFEEAKKNLASQNLNLTGGQKPSDPAYETIRRKNQETPDPSPEESYYEPILLESPKNSSVPIRPEPSNDTSNAHEDYYPVYDMAKWRNENDD